MRNQRQRGFTLVEVLVATAILIASMGVILQLFNAGLNGMHRAGRAQHQLLAQRHIFNALQLVNPSADTQRSGEIIGFKYEWDVERIGTPYFIQANETFAGTNLQLYRFVVRVSDEINEPTTFEFIRMIHQPAIR